MWLEHHRENFGACPNIGLLFFVPNFMLGYFLAGLKCNSSLISFRYKRYRQSTSVSSPADIHAPYAVIGKKFIRIARRR